jgi:hypothetical protein
MRQEINVAFETVIYLYETFSVCFTNSLNNHNWRILEQITVIQLVKKFPVEIWCFHSGGYEGCNFLKCMLFPDCVSCHIPEGSSTLHILCRYGTISQVSTAESYPWKKLIDTRIQCRAMAFGSKLHRMLKIFCSSKH